MSTEVCASAQQLELYHSNVYKTALFFNLAVAITSFVLIILAIRKLTKESIINTSTRILLIFGLLCCSLHQTAYFVLRVQVIYQIFFKLAEPCTLYYKSYDCRFVTFGLVSGNSGMILVQSAMTIDRIFATAQPTVWLKLRKWPGVVLSVMVIVANYLVKVFVFWDDPMTDDVPNCGSLPPKSTPRFKTFLVIGFYLSVCHMLANMIVLYINVLQDRRQSRSFNVNERYQSRETLKSTQAIFFLSMSQMFMMLLYTVLTDLFLQFQSSITVLQYGLAVALIYTTPYTCLLVPTLIILTLSFIKKQRLKCINTMRSQTETGDEHMRKIQKIWDK